jgi:hypothetical protein
MGERQKAALSGRTAYGGGLAGIVASHDRVEGGYPVRLVGCLPQEGCVQALGQRLTQRALNSEQSPKLPSVKELQQDPSARGPTGAPRVISRSVTGRALEPLRREPNKLRIRGHAEEALCPPWWASPCSDNKYPLSIRCFEREDRQSWHIKYQPREEQSRG